MAASVNVLSADPYSVRYRITSDGGGGGAVTRSIAEIKTDLADGPLKNLMASVASASQLNFRVQQGVIGLEARVDTSVAAGAHTVGAQPTSTGLVMSLSAASSAAQVELRLIHSLLGARPVAVIPS